MHLLERALQVVEARVDWLTCSAKRGDRADELIHYAERQVLAEENYGERLEDWRFQGYTGFSCGNVRWGWGKHGALVAMSQERSAECATDLAHLADHWSRIDYAVTVFDVDDAICPPESYWAIYKDRYGTARPPVTLTRIQEFNGGSTVTLGRRTSASYLRCYDKFAETKGDYAKGCWRWELELKREQAEAAQARWRESIVFPPYILGMVRGWPEAHYLPCPWNDNAQLQTAAHIKTTRTVDRSLNWLSTQVAPTVMWVSQAAGEDKVREALNLRLT